MIFDALYRHDLSRIALRDEAHAWTYGDMIHEVDRRAEQLAGVRVMALMMDNSADWVLWDLAALRAGVPNVPLPPFFSQAQVRHALQSAGVSHILRREGMEITKFRARELPSGTVKITYTSGTTGTPKGVCLPQVAMYNVARSIEKVLGQEMAGIHLSALPLGVLLENVAGVYTALMAGATVDLYGLQALGSYYAHIHNRLKAARATSVVLVPEMLRILIRQVAEKGGLPDLRYVAVGGARVAPEIIENARAMGLPVYEGYGLSECASVVSLNAPAQDRSGTTGKILPHVKIDIVDGEVVIRDPGFLGYVGTKTPDSFCTGDLGMMDNDGFLTITGRKKNVLITSFGRNVSPEWVEAVLMAQPEIAQAYVFGDGQPFLSALIVPTISFKTIREAIDATNRSLPDYARVGRYHIVPPFTPENGMLTANGRLRRDIIFHHYRSLTEKEKDYEFLRQAH